jgi:hypothetical protein
VAATVAHLERNDEAAAGSLTGALDAFEAADMRLYAAVTRRRLGALVGGDRGRALRQQAEGWMATEDVRDPVAMSRLIAPGLPD